MPKNGFSIWRAILAISILVFVVTQSAEAVEKVLVNFKGSNGSAPYGALISDAAGNLYGTTTGGGVHSLGTVFELTPNTTGGWRSKILHSFNADGIDGIVPYTRLVFDSAGNLYGTTNNGGSNNVGTVFELTPNTSGTWKETILYSFQNNGTDGNYPYGSLILDSSGTLYGTTAGGGTSFAGTVYELTPHGSGKWVETVLLNFDYTNGYSTYAGLIFDAYGNLYGAAYAGGAYGYGTVFELTPQGSGQWNATVLYNFNGQNSTGDAPYGTLIFDSAGNLYGTTLFGGTYDSGMVFELTPQTSGEWTEIVVHSFEPSNWDSGNPFAGLVMDAAGNLYGTANQGGRFNYGTVFKLTPNADGGWTEQRLHDFNNNSRDGYAPYCTVLLDNAGNLYGVTYQGGTQNSGTVFEIVP
ncbi:MAG TPA: choice-of-anchor tandem repeat GloVer-containing protein [Candidatus Sulfotelmatobacter sp.]